MSLANLIRCVGLVTFGSEISRAEGSLRQALNVNIDEDGVITPRRGFNDYGLPTTGVESTADRVNQLMEYKGSVIRQFGNEFLEYEDSNGVFQSVNGTYNPVRTSYRTKYQESNANLYFTTDVGIKKMSATSRADLNADMVSQAGGLKAGYADGTTVPTIGGFLAPQSKVAYRVLFGTRDNNNNLIYGSPSSRFVVTNFSEDIITYEQQTIFFDTATGGAVADGDHFVFYIGNIKYVVYYDVSGSASTPKTSATLNATYVRVDANGIASDDDSLAAFTANQISSLDGIEVTLDTGSSPYVISITQTGEGDVTDISGGFTSNGSSATTKIITAVSTNGETNEGLSSNVQITGIIPEGASTDYFYQIYRTSSITSNASVSLSEIDPGDEMNLVYEAGLTQEEIDNNEFTVTDTTPASFRNSGLPLYTNEASGEGILQANDVPPIALDLELFKNYMFYGNTKQTHQKEFTIVSVDNIRSGSTRLVIGNNDITRFYLFKGVAQVSSVDFQKVPYEGDYFTAYSANDLRQYYVYFGPTGSDPQIDGASGYRIDISDLTEGDPALAKRETVAQRIVDALIDNVDFDLTRSSTQVTFTYTNNGSTTGLTEGTDSNASFSIATSVTGEGEETGTESGGQVLLSGLTSVGQSIDETARSLVKAISSDSESPVNAYYLSIGEELPGNILLEARTQEDNTFYVAIESGYPIYSDVNLYDPGDYVRFNNLDYVCIQTTSGGNDPSGDFTATAYWQYSPIGDEFTPELSNSWIITSFEESATDASLTTITYAAHGYSDGDEVYVGYFKDPDIPSDPDTFAGVYTISNVTTDTFDIEVNNNGLASFSSYYTAIFSPTVASDNEALPNRIYYSKRRQPEAVPKINFIDVGPQDSEILRLIALRDELYVLKEDGIYIISGTSAPDWSVRLIDSAEILAPDSAAVLNNQIYCLSDQGVIRISGSSAAVISRGIENRINDIVDSDFDYSPNTFGVAYENDRAFLLFAPQQESDTSATQAYRYNIFEKTWSRWEYNANCGLVLKRDNKLYLGNADRNYVSQERKDGLRSDHSDRNFSATINANGISSKTIELSSLVDVAVNDVILQEQEVTLYYINWKLLKKMDLFDTGITPPVGTDGMYDAFSVSTGDNVITAMQGINDHLRSLDATFITAKTFNVNNLRTNTELLVTELNTTGSLTSIKTYKNPQTEYYEAYITSVDRLRNQIEVSVERPFIEGSVEIYKSFTCTIEWNPLHFGNPSAFKQITHMTIMFDQNNFNAAVAKFYTDAAQGSVEVPFSGKGLGYWGDMTFDENTAYWGGDGNDMPFRTIVPRGKQRCRYISISFEHKIAREYFRVIGISASVRQVSDKAYKQLK